MIAVKETQKISFGGKMMVSTNTNGVDGILVEFFKKKSQVFCELKQPNDSIFMK